MIMNTDMDKFIDNGFFKMKFAQWEHLKYAIEFYRFTTSGTLWSSEIVFFPRSSLVTELSKY